MLPGFRFLFSAIVLSMSILIFGLGAAALLRAAHEEFASNPSWRSAPATMFAQPSEASSPMLALLRLDPPSAEQAAPDDAATTAASVTPAPTEETVPADSGPAEAERATALRPEDAALKPEEQAAPAEAAKPEIAVSEPVAPRNEPAPAQADASEAVAETKIAAVEPEPAAPAAPASNPSAATATEPTTINELLGEPAPEIKPAQTNVAARSNPSASVETPRHPKTASPKTAANTKMASAKHDADVEAKEKEKEKEKKRLQALRARRHRIAVARARLARQQAEQLQPANPFAPFVQPPYQPAVQPATP